tara:strand:+ start:158 stop:883 length:726 start_codon:yes stop_codon:yes gene_type:complete
MSLNNRPQLSPTDKVAQMNKKYSNSSLENFQHNTNSDQDIQGWRNKLVDFSSYIYKNPSLLDLGCGLGDKSYRFINKKEKQLDSLHLIDFSNESINFAIDVFKKIDINNKYIIVSDANEYLQKLKDNSINLVFMFGFLHEVYGRKDLLMNLKTVLKENYLVIISDNLLHFKLKILKSELNSVFENSYFFRVQKLVKDYKILYCFNPIMMKVIKHTGRADKFFTITTNYPKYKLKKLLRLQN